MASSYTWKPPQGQPTSCPRHRKARASRADGRPHGPFLAVLVLGLTAALACLAAGFDGATRDNAPAGETSGDATPTETVWLTDNHKALARAAEQNRPVLLRFTATWCPPCQVMDRSVFPDQAVKAALADHVIPVKLDIDEERNAELAWRYGVQGVPTLLLVDADGEVLARGGFMSAEALVRFLRES